MKARNEAPAVADATADAALLHLLQRLAARDYQFITPTPLTHQRVLARQRRPYACTLRDVFGWSLPFATEVPGAELLDLMRAAGVLAGEPGHWRSRIRVSTLQSQLYAHSAYPTLAGDAVFFGPDTYRFARYINANLPPPAALRALDLGCGSGAGALSVAHHLPDAHWTLSDINPEALRLARINARCAGVRVRTVISDVMADLDGDYDLVLCNPPYLLDAQARAYRHGGAGLGRELGLRVVSQASARLRPGGCLLLYSGVAILDGLDPFLAELPQRLDPQRYRWNYEEIDPDVFGEELEHADYRSAERIAAVGLVVHRRATPRVRPRASADASQGALAQACATGSRAGQPRGNQFDGG